MDKENEPEEETEKKKTKSKNQVYEPFFERNAWFVSGTLHLNQEDMEGRGREQFMCPVKNIKKNILNKNIYV